MKLNSIIIPSSATNKIVKWSSSNNNIASVSEVGLVSGNNFGQVTITVETEDGSYNDTCKIKVEHLTIVNTAEITGNPDFNVKIAGTSAKGGGQVINEGASKVKERGLCWNTKGSPTINNSYAADGSGAGDFSNVSMTGLSENTTYYVRAYATNSHTTVYGKQITFNSGYQFGTEAEEGYVFYNDGNGGGLTLWKENIYSGNDSYKNWSFRWMNCGYNAWLKKNLCTLNGNTETNIGAGHANSIAIIDQLDSSNDMIAAKLCLNFDDETYDDWYLPSKDELNLVYINLHTNENAIKHWIIISNHNYGKKDYMSSKYYWTSSEFDASSAWAVYFGRKTAQNPDHLVKRPKGDQLYVRPVRTF